MRTHLIHLTPIIALLHLLRMLLIDPEVEFLTKSWCNLSANTQPDETQIGSSVQVWSNITQRTQLSHVNRMKMK